MTTERTAVLDTASHSRRHAAALAAVLSFAFGCAAPASSQAFAVLARGAGELQAYGASGERIWTADVGPDAHELVVSPDGQRAYVAGYGSGLVTEVDLRTGSVTGRIDLSDWGALHGIALADGERLWVTAEEREAVLEIDLRADTLARSLPTDRARSHMVAVAPAGDRLFVPAMADGVVGVFDLATGERRDVPAGAGAEGVAVTPDGREVWVSNNRDNTISVLDADSGDRIATMPSGGETPVKLRISPDGRFAWVANNRSGSVAVFDVAARTLEASVEVGSRPLGIAFSPDGDVVLVSLAGANEVLALDAATHAVLSRTEVGPSPDGLAWIGHLDPTEEPAAAAAAAPPAAAAADEHAGGSATPEELTFSSGDGTTLYADLHRSGHEAAPLLLMFHQGGSNARAEYAPILPSLLGAGFDALAVDLRRGGDTYGGSNRTVDALGHNDTPYCDVYPDVVASLEQALGAARGEIVIAWGSSYSGTLALRLAAERPESVDAVIAFSPASGGPLADCPANGQAARLTIPTLVVRPAGEAEIPSVQEQLRIFSEAGHRTYVADPGTHGASTLVPDRVEGGGDTAAAWETVLDFLRQSSAR